MNNTSKLSLSIVFTLAFYVISYCQNNSKQQFSMAELTEIAKKYNMENTVQKNTGLMYLDKNKVEEHFQSESKAQIVASETNTFLQKTINVRTAKNYFDLLNTYPIVKAEFLKSHNWTEKNYNDYVATFLKYNWRIYRNSNGGVAFYRADTKVSTSELRNGKRIDSLPKF